MRETITQPRITCLDLPNDGEMMFECWLNPYNAEIFLYKPCNGQQRVFFQFESIINLSQLALSASFEVLCYESTAIIICRVPSVRGSSLEVWI